MRICFHFPGHTSNVSLLSAYHNLYESQFGSELNHGSEATWIALICAE